MATLSVCPAAACRGSDTEWAEITVRDSQLQEAPEGRGGFWSAKLLSAMQPTAGGL